MSGLNAALIVGLFFSFLLVLRGITFSRFISKKVFFLVLFFLFHIIYSFYLNQSLAVIKYLILYLALGLVWIISRKKSFITLQNYASAENFFNITLVVGLVQIIHYMFFIFLSDAYIGISNIDAQARKSVGVYPTLMLISVLFFNREFGSNVLRSMVIPFALIVPFLVFSNGSRSELIFLVFALFAAYLSRGRFGLVLKNSKFLFIIAILTIYLLWDFKENFVLDRLFDFSWSAFDIFGVINMATETSIIAFQNFRLHESALLMQKIFHFNLLEILFGCGVGCSIDYPYPLVLGDLTFYSSTVFHNGFLTLMLQFGLFGLIISLFIINNWLRSSWLLVSNRAIVPLDKLINYLAHSFLVITMLTSGGYTSLIAVCILLPLLYVPIETK